MDNYSFLIKGSKAQETRASQHNPLPRVRFNQNQREGRWLRQLWHYSPKLYQWQVLANLLSLRRLVLEHRIINL